MDIPTQKYIESKYADFIILNASGAQQRHTPFENTPLGGMEFVPTAIFHYILLMQMKI